MKMDSGSLCIVPSVVKSLKFTWKIPQFLSLPGTSDYSLDSSPFIFANASWCLRLHPNEQFGTCISLVRLHSLIWYHKIRCTFDVQKENGEYFQGDHGYSKLKYNEDFRERKYFIGEIPDRSGLDTAEKVCSADGSLVLVGHLLFQESTKNEHLQKCVNDFSNLYKKKEEEQNSSILSLKFSKVQSLKIRWKIPEYFSLPESVGYSLTSPTFDFGCATWFFKLYPNGIEDNPDTIISLVRSRSLVSLFHEIIYTCNVIGENGKCFNYNFEYSKFSFKEDCEIKDFYITFDDRSTLFEDHCVIAPNCNVTFFYHFFYEESTVRDEALQKMEHELDMYKTFGLDLKNLLLNGKGHDLILKVKGKEFRVHRYILSARSPVFESMLTHDMSEKSSGIVDITDCDPSVMEQLLLYVYCGKMDSLNETNMLGLYYAADKYGMMHLKEECRGFIQNSLSCRNICDVFQLAMSHSDEDLVESATEFFVKNKNEILTSSEWNSFMEENEGVANELLNKSMTLQSETSKMEDVDKCA